MSPPDLLLVFMSPPDLLLVFMSPADLLLVFMSPADLFHFKIFVSLSARRKSPPKKSLDKESLLRTSLRFPETSTSGCV